MEFRFSRVWAVVLRYFYGHHHNISKVFDFLFWPMLDVILFGFIGIGGSCGYNPQLIASLMIGLVLWQVSHRTSQEISRNLLQELWDDNLLNFFATPLSIAEWIIGLILVGIISLIITIPYGALLVWVMFGYNIFTLGLGLSILPLIALLIISGWILGFISAGFLIYWGQKLDIVVWAITWIPTPLCSIYYPVEILPHWMQTVSKYLPMTYTFEGIRFAVNTGQTPYWHMGMSLALNIAYLIVSLCFFLFMLKKSRAQGLSCS